MDAIPRLLVLDFGSQYSHLIVRRCRERGVYAELQRCDVPLDTISSFHPVGLILSGGPFSVYKDDAPHVQTGFWDLVIQKLKVPVLGICYGMQEMQQGLGGRVVEGHSQQTGGEYGPAKLALPATPDSLFEDVPDGSTVWMSHGDRVTELAPGFTKIATSPDSGVAAVVDVKRHLWGLQFHPEVTHTERGSTILGNFIRKICGVTQPSWSMEHFAPLEIEALRKKVGGARVIGALSGGVDSTVAACLLHKAIGDRFHGIVVDTGLLRKDEADDIEARLRRAIPGLQFQVVDAAERFFSALEGVSDPELKRKTIGHMFIKVFVSAHAELKKQYPAGSFDDAFLLQGTLYPDVIESVSFKGPSHTIKSHHNVGGLPEHMHMRLLEPLRELFKDEVRTLGLKLGLDAECVWRHPFPGPGLAIRIIGEITRERVSILQHADAIFIEELRASKEYERCAQAFVVLLPDCKSVGVMGDCRTYAMTAVLRAIRTSDFMTGDWHDLPYGVLRRCSTRIINEVSAINRVCYDISSKPPATIEWE